MSLSNGKKIMDEPINAKKKLNNETKTPQNLGDFTVFGRYTVFIIITYEFLLMPQMFNMTFMIFGAHAPRVVSCGKENFRNLSLVDSCAAFKEAQNQTGCIPNLEAQFNSLAYEFNYFCDKIHPVKHSISILMFGVLCGAVIFGQLSDWFGRKKIMLVAHIGITILNFLASRSSNLQQFTIIQFFAMMFVGGHNSIMHVFLLENIPKQFRVLLTTVVSYSPNFIILSGVAYFANDWRTLLQICSFLNVPAVCLLLLAFESPRWLIQKAYLEDARVALLKIEKINGTATPERLAIIDEIIEHEMLQNEEKRRKRKYYFYHLFYTWKLCSYTAVISWILASVSVVNYALLFNMEHLPGTIFVSTALFGVFRYAMNLVVGGLDYFVEKAGRKFIHSAALGYILVMLLIIIVSKLIGFYNNHLLQITTITSAAMCSQMYIVNGIVTSELFPTAIRNLAVSFVQISNRFGAVLAPHLFITATYWEPLPYIVMFLILLISMLLFGIFIPETKGNPMADHMPNKNERIVLRRKAKSQIVLSPTSAKLVEDF